MAGHTMVCSTGMILSVLGLIIGWPVALPTLLLFGYLSDVFGFGLNNAFFHTINIISVIIGTYVHFKIWAWIFSAVKNLFWSIL